MAHLRERLRSDWNLGLEMGAKLALATQIVEESKKLNEADADSEDDYEEEDDDDEEEEEENLERSRVVDNSIHLQKSVASTTVEPPPKVLITEAPTTQRVPWFTTTKSWARSPPTKGGK